MQLRNKFYVLFAYIFIMILSNSEVLAQGDNKLNIKPQPNIPNLSKAQESELNPSSKMDLFSPQEMVGKWQQFGKDKAWKALLKEAQEKGFKLGTETNKRWGAEGVVNLPDENGEVSNKTKAQKVLFCIYDLEPNSKGEHCSMLWAKRGDEVYKAYIVIPKGKGIENANEWYANEDGKVIEAHSWKSCFFKRIKQICGPVCGGALIPCALAAGATVTAAGVGAITSPAVFLGCMAGACLGCSAIVAAACAAP